MKVKSIGHNYIMNMILKMASFIFPLITFPYVSRVLGADGNGRILVATSLVSGFSMFAYLGIPTHGVKICAQCRENKEELSRTVQELMIISAVATILTYIALIFAVRFTPKWFENRDVILTYSLLLILNCFGAEWFYQSIEQYDYITYRNLLFKILSVLLMFVFVKDRSDYVKYAGVAVIGTAGSNILNFLRLRKHIYMRPMKTYCFKRHLKPVFTFFLLSVSTVIYTNLDAVMLGFMTSNTEVGYYNAAIKIKNILVGVTTALGTVVLPRIAYYLKNKKDEDFRRVIGKSFQFVILLALPLTIYFVIEAGDVIAFLAGSEYEAAIVPMMLITPTIFFVGLSNITGIQMLVPMGREKDTVFSTVCGAVIDIILNIFFIPKWGAAGAALSTLIAEIAVLLIQILCLKDKLHGLINFGGAIKVVNVSVVATICLIAVKLILPQKNIFVSLVITAVVFFGTGLIGLVLTREEIIAQYFIKKIVDIIKKRK